MAIYQGTEASDTLSGGGEDDQIFGLDGDDALDGGAGNDALYGGDGRDRLDGGSGDDFIEAAEGDGVPARDVVRAGRGDDLIYAGWGDDVDGGAGIDGIGLFYGAMTAGLTLDLRGLNRGGAVTIGGGTIRNVDHVSLLFLTRYDDVLWLGDGVIGARNSADGADGDDVIRVGAGGYTLDGGGGDDALYGGTDGDNLRGGEGVDILEGGSGDDVLLDAEDTVADSLLGGGGDDQIYLGYGDTADGGAGFDRLTVSFFAADRGVTADFGAIASGGSVTIGGGTIGGMEAVYRVEGSRFADRLALGDAPSGVDGNVDPYGHALAGYDGDDELTGGRNDDQMSGGEGDDMLKGLDGRDSLAGEAGDDVVEGGAEDDFIAGGDGRDDLSGGDGDDVMNAGGNSDDARGDALDGGDGDDAIQAGPGDHVDGGAGNDRLSVFLFASSEALRLDFRPGNDGAGVLGKGGSVRGIERLNAVLGSGDDVLDLAGLEYATVDAGGGKDRVVGGGGRDELVGGAGDDRLSGADGADWLRGGIGTDRLDGGAGDDVLDGGDGDVFGGDVASYAAAAAGVTVSLLVDGAQETGGAGRDTLIAIESLEGSAFADVLTVAAFGATALGGAGDDTLTTAGGFATLDGGTGADVLIGTSRSAGDLLIAGDVADEVSVDRITGGGGDDLIRAGWNDAIDGRGGADRLELDFTALTSGVVLDLQGMSGRAGVALGSGTVRSIEAVDRIELTSGDDIVRLDASGGPSQLDGRAGDDMLRGSALGETLQGSKGKDQLFGLRGDDMLDGGVGNDRVEGGAGTDRLTGGAGRDVLSGGADADTFVFDDGDAGRTSRSADLIRDFSAAERDVIDLRLIDARGETSDEDAFDFIGAADFSHTAGELRIARIGQVMFVQGDTDGDGLADLFIQLSGVSDVAVSDFLL